MINLRLRSTGQKPVKYTHVPNLYVSNYSWRSNNNFYYGNAQTRIPKLTRWCSRICRIIYFKGRSLILAPNIRQEKRYFCVLVCCTCSAMYLAGQHLKKLDLNWKFYTPKCISYAQRRKVLINITKVYLKHQISLSADLANICRVSLEGQNIWSRGHGH